MGIKDFLGKKKDEISGKAHQSYESFKEGQAEKKELGNIRKTNERETYRKESRIRAKEEGILRGRNRAKQPSIKDRVVGGVMGSGEKKGGIFNESFVNVNTENLRTQGNSLSSGFNDSFFGHQKQAKSVSPIHQAMFGSNKKGNSFGGSALSQAFNFGSSHKTHHKKHSRKKR
jgi:hypothetical protein